MTVNSKHVKVAFEITNDDGSTEIETLWAIPVENGYQIDNIPFYAQEIAIDDVVSAEPDEEGMLRFSGLVKASGHSTVRLWFACEADVASVRAALRTLGCASELNISRLVAVDVPPSIPYAEIRAYLDERERSGLLEFEEACLGIAVR